MTFARAVVVGLAWAFVGCTVPEANLSASRFSCDGPGAACPAGFLCSEAGRCVPEGTGSGGAGAGGQGGGGEAGGGGEGEGEGEGQGEGGGEGEGTAVTERAGAKVQGQVTVDTADQGQPPLPGAFLLVEGVGLWATADEGGNYLLRDVPVGEYLLTVHPPDGAVQPLERPSLGQVTFRVQPEDVGETVIKDLVMQRRGDLLGRVVLRGRNRFDPVHGGVRITVVGAPGHEELSDPDGRFLLPSLPAGERVVRFFVDGYFAQEHRVEVEGLQRRTLATFNPDPTDAEWVDGAVNLRVTDAAGDAWMLKGEVLTDEGVTTEGLELVLAPLFSGEVRRLTLRDDDTFEETLPMGGVFNLFVRGPGWRSGRLSQVAMPGNEGGEGEGEGEGEGDEGNEGEGGVLSIQVRPLRVGGVDGVPDLDEDGLSDDEDDDRDGDGCLNDVDEFPDDPLGCSDADGDGVSDPIDNDDDGDGVDDLEEARLGADGLATDPRSANFVSEGDIRTLEGTEGSADGTFRIVGAGAGVVMVEAPVQRPLYGDARTAQLLLQAQELSLPAGSGARIEVDLAGLPPSAGSGFGVFATLQPCPDGFCEVTNIQPLACATDGWRGEARCTGALAFPAPEQAQTWRVWVRPTQRDNGPVEPLFPPEDEAPSEYNCIGVAAAYPIYGLLHRHIALSRGDFDISAGGGLANPYLPACFTGQTRFQDVCTPWHVRDGDSDDLVMTSFTVTPVESAFQACYQIRNADSGNPLLFLPGHAILCNPLTLHATFSDGLGAEEATVQIDLTPLGSSVAFGVFGECWF